MKKKKSSNTAKGGAFGPDDMDRLLRGCGVELNEEQLSLLWQYHKLLRRYNPELNLTRIHRFENMVLKLYADSILPVRFVELPSVLLDIGTGAGMPGIPVKIARPDIKVVLAESRGGRVDFLKTVTAELGLTGIEVWGHSINESYEREAEGIITRAVESMSKTLGRVQGCLEREGLAVFMKGPYCDNEIKEAEDLFKKSFRLLNDIAYKIPGTEHQRRLVIFQRKDIPVRKKLEKAMNKHPVKVIESQHNPTFRELKKLLTGKGSKKQEKALISGSKQVHEIIPEFGSHCLAWISDSERLPPPEDLPDHAAWYRLEPGLFKTLDIIGTNSPLLLVKTPPIPTWDPLKGMPPGCSVLVPFQDPENVGNLIRSAAAFDADKVILLSEAAYPFHPRSVRASGGAVMHVEMMQGPSIHDLPENLPITVLSVDGTPVGKFDFPGTFGLLPGMEGPGIPDQLVLNKISVPISRRVESLNAATATAIALYVWSQAKIN